MKHMYFTCLYGDNFVIKKLNHAKTLDREEIDSFNGGIKQK